MKNFIVITSINHPTKAVLDFAQIPGWHVVVVGDKKTPTNFWGEGIIYLSCKYQEKQPFKLPWNNYVRKMLGYLYAIENGAEYIYDTDDDNFPYENWGFPDTSENDCLVGKGFTNVYKMFSNRNIWPRGFPLNHINDRPVENVIRSRKPVGVWQGLADNDPDVDAIYRMTTSEDGCIFSKRPPLVLDEGLVCPFNSQNTLFRKELFPLLYLPVTVNQRFADILRGYVAQPIMWKAGYLLGFTEATVTQLRNEHDLMTDFIDEIPCYTQSEMAFNVVNDAVSSTNDIEENILSAYHALIKAGVVKGKETQYLCEWLEFMGKNNEI